MNVPQNKSIQISVASRDLKVILFDKIQTFSVRACAFARTRAGVDEFCANRCGNFFRNVHAGAVRTSISPFLGDLFGINVRVQEQKLGCWFVRHTLKNLCDVRAVAAENPRTLKVWSSESYNILTCFHLTLFLEKKNSVGCLLKRSFKSKYYNLTNMVI